ncbi:MAG: hypothetical protein ACQESO_05625, partial [Bacillota bacterium]
GFMIFVRMQAHINHNWGLFIFQRPFSFITGMLFYDVNLLIIFFIKADLPFFQTMIILINSNYSSFDKK